MIDTRVGKGSKVSYIRHGGCVTHIKKVDDHHLVVNGLRSSVCFAVYCMNRDNRTYKLTGDFF